MTRNIYKDINERLRQLNVRLKPIYNSTRNEQQFKSKVLEEAPTITKEFFINHIDYCLHCMYKGFCNEQLIMEAINENYTVSDKGYLDLKYQIDVLVNYDLAIQIKSVNYFNNTIVKIGQYLAYCGLMAYYELSRTSDINIINYLFMFYDNKDNGRLYYITYRKLTKIIINLYKNGITEVSFKEIKQYFTEIGFVDDFYLDNYLKEIIDSYLE